ncbi:MAG: 5,6-dimethylbenzimidazole synthase [Acidimicrobiales bacterium]
MDLTNVHPIYDTIMRRRDVRSEFTGEPIPAATLRRILEAAHCAPSVGLSQPWDFVVVAAAGTRKLFQEHVAAERKYFGDSLPAELATRFQHIKIEGIMESSVGIVVTYDPTRGGPHVLGRHAIDDAGLYSTCLAIQNLWLAATAEQCGVGWVSFYREAFVQHLLELPTNVRPVAWLCVGPVSRFQDTPDLERHRWQQRRPIEEAIHFERW